MSAPQRGQALALTVSQLRARDIIAVGALVMQIMRVEKRSVRWRITLRGGVLELPPHARVTITRPPQDPEAGR